MLRPIKPGTRVASGEKALVIVCRKNFQVRSEKAYARHGGEFACGFPWKDSKSGLDEWSNETKIIAETGASGIASMGKVMGLASTQLGGTAEGKTISNIVKKLLV